MRIAYIVPSLVNKGPVIVVHGIVKNIISEQILVDVFYFDDPVQLDFPCSTFKIEMNTPFDFDQYDIVHSHGYRSDKYVSKWIWKIKKAKTVSTIHSDIAQDLKYTYNTIISLIFSRLWLHFISKIDVVTVISNKLENIYSQKFEKLYRIYNGAAIELQEFNVTSEIVNSIHTLKKKGYSIIGTYANLTKIKGIDQIINLLKFRNDLALVVIGEGNEKKKLIAKAIKLGVIDRVLFYPYVVAPYNYIHLFDIYAMPSRSEGFGLALVEAALTKAAILCSDIPVFHEIFNEEQVTFFKLEDLNSMSLAVDTAILTKKSKGFNAYNHAVCFFSEKIMADNYRRLYETLL